MRNYLIEDLYPEQLDRIISKLNSLGYAGPLDGIFYLPMPEALLTAEQRDHLPECGPYICALESLEDSLKLELLVRARGKLRCSCVAYATPEQRAYIIDTLDELIRQMDISV